MVTQLLALHSLIQQDKKLSRLQYETTIKHFATRILTCESARAQAHGLAFEKRGQIAIARERRRRKSAATAAAATDKSGTRRATIV